MDDQLSSKQLTLTQYSMSRTCENDRCAKEEIHNETNRAIAIRSVKSSIKSHSSVFAWNRQSRNDDITEITDQRNKEVIALDDNDSEDDFMPKPQRKYAKPTFTCSPHPPQCSTTAAEYSTDDDVVVAQVVKVSNQKVRRGTKRKKARKSKQSPRKSFIEIRPTQSDDDSSVEDYDHDEKQHNINTALPNAT